MKRYLVKLTNNKEKIIECSSYYNVNKKHTFLHNTRIIHEYENKEVTSVKELSSLPFGFGCNLSANQFLM